jgi:ATP-dependent RNA helicase DDX49/DBP8
MKKRQEISVDELLRRQEQNSTRAVKRQKITHSSMYDDGSNSESEEGSRSDVSGEENDVTDDSFKDDEDEEESRQGEDERLEFGDRLGSLIKTKLPFPPPPSETPQNPRSFSSFGISKALVAVLTSMSIKVPTEVQTACIPPLLSGALHPVSLLFMHSN